jgi:hypothetical protein
MATSPSSGISLARPTAMNLVRIDDLIRIGGTQAEFLRGLSLLANRRLARLALQKRQVGLANPQFRLQRFDLQGQLRRRRGLPTSMNAAAKRALRRGSCGPPLSAWRRGQATKSGSADLS